MRFEASASCRAHHISSVFLESHPRGVLAYGDELVVARRWLVRSRSRFARKGGQDPFCGSASVIYVGVLGSYMRIRRGRPVECAAVESK